MIKLICFDFDGTLADLKEVHFLSLNKALESIDKNFIITEEEHVSVYDGLSTSKKLDLLIEKGFSKSNKNRVAELKQKYTIESINEKLNPNNNVISFLSYLKQNNFKICLASNAIRETLEVGLKKLNIDHFFDKIYSNQDVYYQKPNSEIFLRCMADFGVSPKETIIIEDSKHGRESAVKSEAWVYGVDSPDDLSINNFNSILNYANKPSQIKWAGKANVNVVIPMSGAGSRFAKAGFELPKPLINVNGKPMIKVVIDNLNIDATYTFIVQKEHYKKYNLKYLLEEITPNCNIIQVDGVTEGAACSVLLAKDIINNDKHLLIANSDQFIEWDSCDFMYKMLCSQADGGILTFTANDPKWSFVKLNDKNEVIELAEKKVISNIATVGIYYYKKGSDFISCAEEMIKNNIRVNNEFYVAPVYNIMISNNSKIITYNCKMHGLGTPEDLEIFLKNEKFR